MLTLALHCYNWWYCIVPDAPQCLQRCSNFLWKRRNPFSLESYAHLMSYPHLMCKSVEQGLFEWDKSHIQFSILYLLSFWSPSSNNILVCFIGVNNAQSKNVALFLAVPVCPRHRCSPWLCTSETLSWPNPCWRITVYIQCSVAVVATLLCSWNTWNMAHLTSFPGWWQKGEPKVVDIIIIMKVYVHIITKPVSSTCILIFMTRWFINY